ncbi:MAG TPA: hypothetical protein VMG10_06625 [Gemmataceae bacterium]|nr:hypothetical protein [Gemmataceae bacterium]
MARARYRLTLALQEKIVSFIRAGGFAHVAAEAAGLPHEVFARWLERGERAGAPANYRAFARAIREAEAQARLQAELNVRGDKPLDWLKAGPGKDSADNPGWGGSGKGGSATADKVDRAQVWSEVLHLFGRCAEQLAAHPDARAALSAWLASLPPSEEK